MKSLIATIFSGFAFLIVAFLIFYSVIEYKPKEITQIPEYVPQKADTDFSSKSIPAQSLQSSEISLLTWNIGYGGMGKDMDYYFDGGKRVNPSENEFRKNFAGISNFISESSKQINLFQEVDVNSQRSYFTDMAGDIQKLLGGTNYFAANYKNPFVLFPIKSPIGKVHGGLFTSSIFSPDKVQMIPLPSENDWPKSLFNLKRCILELRFKFKGKELIVGNIHNSAFDKGDIRDKQLSFIAERYMEEYDKGNYVILGGDFNMTFPMTEVEGKYISTEMIPINADLFPTNWKFAYDKKKPTNRDGGMAYDPSISGLSTIDGFLLSPNVKLIEVKVKDLGFENSDHQPVIAKVMLN